MYNEDEIINDELTMLTLPVSESLAVTDQNDFYKMAFQFQKIMMIYESAIKQIETKLDILNKESKVNRKRNPIETVKSRIKTPDSIAKKLEKKNLDMIVANNLKVAGAGFGTDTNVITIITPDMEK